MSDQCKNCQVRGDYEKCQQTECFHHENWINKERMKRIPKWVSLESQLPEPNQPVIWYDRMFDEMKIFSMEYPEKYDGDYTHWMSSPKIPDCDCNHCNPKNKSTI